MLTRFFVILLFLSNICLAQNRTPKYSNEFLSLGVGARALGMSNVQTALASDVTAGYWNPSGLAEMQNKYQAGLMHASYFAGVANYDYAGFCFRIDTASAMAISIIRFAVDDIPDTRFLYDADGSINYDRISFFSAAEYAFIASYGRKVRSIPGLNIGMNVKVVHRNVGRFASAWGFGLDASVLFHRNDWMFGLMLRDATGTFNAWSHNRELIEESYIETGNEIPQNALETTLPKAIIGVGKKFGIFNHLSLTTAADLDITFDGQRNTLYSLGRVSADPHAGIEFDYAGVAFIRFGVKNIQQYETMNAEKAWEYEPDFGVGVKIQDFKIDYAFTDIGNQSESLYSHVFSLGFGFGEKK